MSIPSCTVVANVYFKDKIIIFEGLLWFNHYGIID